MSKTLLPAAALSFLAAAIHAWVMPEHWQEWWGYGTFFLAVAIAQAAYGLVLLRWPLRLVFSLGIATSLALIVLYLVTRSIGIPPWGPHAGHVEEVQSVDLVAKAAELMLAVTLVALLRVRPQHRSATLGNDSV